MRKKVCFGVVMSYVNILMYVVIFSAVAYITIAECADWFCEDLHGLTFKECKGEGMPYRGSTPKEGDDVPTLLTKIDIGAQTDTKAIKWRRASLLSALIMLAMWLLICTPGRLPEWHQYYLSFMIGFAILYFGFNYYSYHYNVIAEKNIRTAVSMIRRDIVSRV